jgi:hypothetical protein
VFINLKRHTFDLLLYLTLVEDKCFFRYHIGLGLKPK